MKIAVLGCGNMGRAVIDGLLKQGIRDLTITAYDKLPAAGKGLNKKVTFTAPDTWLKGRSKPDAVILAVKPQDLASSLGVFADSPGRQDPLWISIAAGIPIHVVTDILGEKTRVCRVMPNTPALVGEALSAYSMSRTCRKKDETLAKSVLESLGRAVAVPEKMMDAVTGLSGSGPAYVFLFIEAMIEGGVTAGLPRDVARECAVQTVVGAATMARESKLSPSELKAQVMSPGGTTARGLMELEKNGFKYSVINAVTAAARRSAELGNQ